MDAPPNIQRRVKKVVARRNAGIQIRAVMTAKTVIVPRVISRQILMNFITTIEVKREEQKMLEKITIMILSGNREWI